MVEGGWHGVAKGVEGGWGWREGGWVWREGGTNRSHPPTKGVEGWWEGPVDDDPVAGPTRWTARQPAR